jgi:hypothetical protein
MTAREFDENVAGKGQPCAHHGTPCGKRSSFFEAVWMRSYFLAEMILSKSLLEQGLRGYCTHAQKSFPPG